MLKISGKVDKTLMSSGMRVFPLETLTINCQICNTHQRYQVQMGGIQSKIVISNNNSEWPNLKAHLKENSKCKFKIYIFINCNYMLYSDPDCVHEHQNVHQVADFKKQKEQVIAERTFMAQGEMARNKGFNR